MGRVSERGEEERETEGEGKRERERDPKKQLFDFPQQLLGHFNLVDDNTRSQTHTRSHKTRSSEVISACCRVNLPYCQSAPC